MQLCTGQDAYETAVRGLEWSVRRRGAGCETLTQYALALRLCAARCLRRLSRLDEAEYAFKVLAGTKSLLSNTQGSYRTCYPHAWWFITSM